MAQDKFAIKPKQAKALAALLSGDSVGTAARTAGVSVRTVYRWMSGGAFRAALLEQDSHRVQVCSARFTGLFDLALGSLQADLLNPMSRGHRDARRLVVAYWRAVNEYVALSARLDELEGIVKSGKYKGKSR